MPYIANQYNYAAPLSSAVSFISEQAAASDKKYFTLFDNTLDGSYYPITGDVGLWGATLANADGALNVPFIITVTENLTVNAFRLLGSEYSYPVAFTVTFYNGSTILYTITETLNNNVEYVHYLPKTLNVTSYVLNVTRISAANSVVRLRNLYNLGYVKRADKLNTASIDISNLSSLLSLLKADTLRMKGTEQQSHVLNTIDVTRDNLKMNTGDAGVLTNVHTRMKDPSRRIYGKVYVTYTDPMLAGETEIISSNTAYNSYEEQLMDSVVVSNGKLFTLYENDLSGNYKLGSPEYQVGWTSKQLSGADGLFVEPYPSVTIKFAARPVTNLSITFEDAYGVLPVDFSVTYTQTDGNSVTKEFVDNTSYIVNVADSVSDVVSVTLTVTKVSKTGYPVTVLEIPVVSTLLYAGYKDTSDLISIDLLEELTYEDDIEALGGVSANEVSVVFDNSDKRFFFNNKESLIASQLKRNRKIVPWLGAEVVPGEIEWYTLGTFWSYKWDVPVNGLTASVVAFDTLGLLDTTSFTNHVLLRDTSIGGLIEYVLEDAKLSLDFIEYKIDPSLYEIIIPYAWFERGSHTAAIRRISQCYPMHIYCDREGTICTMPQKLQLDFYYDTWADNTNVIGKSYSSLHTTVPNIINVTVKNPVVASDELVREELVFDVTQIPTRILEFNKPYISDIAVTIDCDETVAYTYEIFSWGIEFSFTGTGNVRSIICSGACLDTSNTAVVTDRDEASIRLNGAVTRDIQSDFIQTSSLAAALLSRLKSLSSLDKYDASVDYRGDIALTINDPILLLDGIAPDNRYNIKRHQLFWNGALSGSADLNT